MDLKSRFIALQNFLKEHEYLYQTEALDRFKEDIPKQYTDWIADLSKLNQVDLLKIENELKPVHTLSTEFQLFMKRCKELRSIDSLNLSTKEIDQELKRKFSRKKIHEIKCIQAQIETSPQLNTKQEIIDIGSGAGHLSSVLINGNKKSSQCIDLNKDIQEIGKTKLAKYFPEISSRLTFKQYKVEKRIKTESKDSIFIGLHSCGDLSTHTITSAVESGSALLNYGCCYHKMTIQNISQASLVSPISFTNHALTMAAKSYKPLLIEDDDQRKRVKNYRYTLHFILLESGESFRSLGNANREDYKGSFSFYCNKYAPQSVSQFSEKYLDDYYNSQANKENLKKILNLGVLRSMTARLVELYIILDRAIYLEENGHTVEVTEVFDRSLSPRNLSIAAW